MHQHWHWCGPAATSQPSDAICLLLGGENLDILAQRALIAFEREEVIGLLVQDRRGDIALAAHRVDSHDGPLDRHHIEQCRDDDYFDGLFRHLDCPNTTTRAPS